MCFLKSELAVLKGFGLVLRARHNLCRRTVLLAFGGDRTLLVL